MGSKRRRRNRQAHSAPPALADSEPAVDPEVLDRPSPLDLVRRILIQIAVVVGILVGGAVLAIVGVVISLRGSGGTRGLVIAVVGLLMFLLARVLVRGGGRRWVLRGVGLPLETGP